ncbi:MAG: putative transporter [Cytophagales bacterium]|nr:putative transporter [Cytophagales bacterium]
MFRSFFLNRKWMHWSILGSALILFVTWYKVELNVKINNWFGTFYDSLQRVLQKPGSMTLGEYNGMAMTFLEIASVSIVLAVLLDFFTKHFVFRWRMSMNDFYADNWHKVRNIEGASQRVQEDTLRFARLVESLGVSFMRSVMTLVAFLPILWTLSEKVTELPWLGKVDHSLVYVAVIFALFGTVVLAVVGIKLPGLEFNNQRVEAAYRKELVIGEDDASRAAPPTLKALFEQVRINNYRLYFHYMYFDVAKWSYLQFGVLVPYIALGPAVIAGALTFGAFQQIVRAFGQVESSFQYLVNSWTDIVELISVFKRLRAFEQRIREV